jgi:hypothetical protein
MADPTPVDLVHELREELGLFSGAMPITPKAAWEEALNVVRLLRSGRCHACLTDWDKPSAFVRADIARQASPSAATTPEQTTEGDGRGV